MTCFKSQLGLNWRTTGCCHSSDQWRTMSDKNCRLQVQLNGNVSSALQSQNLHHVFSVFSMSWQFDWEISWQTNSSAAPSEVSPRAGWLVMRLPGQLWVRFHHAIHAVLPCWLTEMWTHVNAPSGIPPELLQGLQHQDLEFQVLVFVWKAKTLKV